MRSRIIFMLLFFVLICLPLTRGLTPTAEAYWWDRYGEPDYGGTLTYTQTSLDIQLDPYSSVGHLISYYAEGLFKPSWTKDRSVWEFKTLFTPDEYVSGCLAESWDMPDAQTIIIHLHKGVTWQDKLPVNGREFVADDVKQHYDRILGKGKYSVPSFFYSARLALLDSIEAPDKYTVKIKFQKALQKISIFSEEKETNIWKN